MTRKEALNPYNWTASAPKFPVLRSALLDRVMDHLGNNEGTVLLGSRGMGKTVFLTQLGAKIAEDPDLTVVAFPDPPAERDIRSAVRAIACKLADAAHARRPKSELAAKLRALGDRGTLVDIFNAYLTEFSAEVERLVLIFDEVDQYADPPEFGRRFFNSLEAVRKPLAGRLTFIVAGGLRLLAMDTELGSTFFTRMKSEVVEPLDIEDLEKLAAPFETLLAPDVLNAIYMGSGGNALLATYALQYLWNLEARTEHAVLDIFRTFEASGSGPYKSVRDGVAGEGVAGVPFQVLKIIQRNHGKISKKELEDVCSGVAGIPKLEKEDVFDILRASGLVRVDRSSVNAGDVILAHLIPSIISFRLLLTTNAPSDSLQDQLADDIREVLLCMHAMSPAFYRPVERETSAPAEGEPTAPEARVGRKRAKPDDKQLVPESVFVAGIVLGLSPRGWRCEVDPVSGGGYADIKARHAGFGEQKAIVEVKIWPRNDYKDIHEQVTAYFADGVTALATVMIRETKSLAWKDEYEKLCLEGKVDSCPWREIGPPLDGYFEARKGAHVVHHFLLGLPTRR